MLILILWNLNKNTLYFLFFTSQFSCNPSNFSNWLGLKKQKWNKAEDALGFFFFFMLPCSKKEQNLDDASMWDESLIIHKRRRKRTSLIGLRMNLCRENASIVIDGVCISLDTAEGIIILGVWMVGASYRDSQLLGQKKKTKWQREKPKERVTIRQLIIKVVPSRKSWLNHT